MNITNKVYSRSPSSLTYPLFQILDGEAVSPCCYGVHLHGDFCHCQLRNVVFRLQVIKKVCSCQPEKVLDD